MSNKFDLNELSVDSFVEHMSAEEQINLKGGLDQYGFTELAKTIISHVGNGPAQSASNPVFNTGWIYGGQEYDARFSSFATDQSLPAGYTQLYVERLADSYASVRYTVGGAAGYVYSFYIQLTPA